MASALEELRAELDELRIELDELREELETLDDLIELDETVGLDELIDELDDGVIDDLELEPMQ